MSLGIFKAWLDKTLSKVIPGSVQSWKGFGQLDLMKDVLAHAK